IDHSAPETHLLVLGRAGWRDGDDERVAELPDIAIPGEPGPVLAHLIVPERAPEPAAPWVDNPILVQNPHPVTWAHVIDLAPALILPAIFSGEIAKILVVEFHQRGEACAVGMDEHRYGGAKIEMVNGHLLELPRRKDAIEAPDRRPFALKPGG